MFFIKKSLSYEMNVYKLYLYEILNDTTIKNIFLSNNKDLFLHNPFCNSFFSKKKLMDSFSKKNIASVYSTFLIFFNTNGTFNGLRTTNNIQQCFSESPTVSDDLKNATEDIYDLISKSYHEFIEQSKSAYNQDIDFRSIFDGTGNISFDNPITNNVSNINELCGRIVTGLDSISWIFANPTQSFLVIDTYILNISILAFLMVFFASIFISMFSGKKELTKLKGHLKGTIVISFVLKFIAYTFIVKGGFK